MLHLEGPRIPLMNQCIFFKNEIWDILLLLSKISFFIMYLLYSSMLLCIFLNQVNYEQFLHLPHYYKSHLLQMSLQVGKG